MEFSSILFWCLPLALYVCCLVTVVRSMRTQERQGVRTNLCLTVLAILSLFFSAELAFRIRHLVVRKIPLLASVEPPSDLEMGWPGNQRFGALTTKRRRILVVGDSFTDGMGVVATSLYDQVLGRELNAEIFTYGGKGYGTLQELMVVDKFKDTVHPDLILLQVCSNDVMNNDLRLERKTYFQNALTLRPYLIDGSIQYLYPKSYGALRVFLGYHSRTFHFLFVKYEVFLLQLAKWGVIRSVEQDIAERQLRFPPLLEGLKLTNSIVARLKASAGAVPIVAFLSDDVPPYTVELRRIFDANVIPLITSIATELNREEKRGYPVRLEDAVHWNAHGQEMVGHLLADVVRHSESWKSNG